MLHIFRQIVIILQSDLILDLFTVFYPAAVANRGGWQLHDFFLFVTVEKPAAMRCLAGGC